MKHRIVKSAATCIAVAFLALALTARAAEDAPEENRYAPLPAGIVAHVSIANAKEFLDESFAFTGEATKDTASYIPGEVLRMLLNTYCPLPMDSWDVENEVHAVFVGDSLASAPAPVLVFAYNTFDELLAGLEQAGCTVADAMKETGETDFADVRKVSLPNGRTKFFLADLGTGWAVASTNFEAATLAALHPEWEIEHLSDADVFARMAIPASGADISGKMLAEITGGADELAKAVAEAGLKADIAAWITEFGKKYSGLVGDELEQAEEFQLELDFDEGNLVLAFAARFADGAWTRKWADAMDAAEFAPDTEMAVLLPEGAFTAAVGAPLQDLVPDIQTFYTTLLTELAQLAPEQKDKDTLTGFAEAFFALNPGTSVSAGYFNAGRPAQVTAVEVDDSAKALDLVRDMIAAAGGIAEHSFADKSQSVAFPMEKQTDGEFEWYCWKPEPADAEKFAAFLDRLNGMNGGIGLGLDPDTRFYAGEFAGKVLITFFGPAEQDAFAAILKNIQTLAETTPAEVVYAFDTPEAEDALDSVDAAQLSVGLVDPDQAYAFYAAAQTELLKSRMSPDMEDGVRKTLTALIAAREQAAAKLAADTEKKSPPAAFGIGGADGAVTASLAIPPATVRTIIQDHELLQKAARDATRAAARAGKQ